MDGRSTRVAEKRKRRRTKWENVETMAKNKKKLKEIQKKLLENSISI